MVFTVNISITHATVAPQGVHSSSIRIVEINAIRDAPDLSGHVSLSHTGVYIL